jgi:hypothetical protein
MHYRIWETKKKHQILTGNLKNVILKFEEVKEKLKAAK